MAAQLLEAQRHRLQGVLGIGFSLRPSQVRENYGTRAALEQQLYRRQRRANACVVRDVAIVVERDVEVDADERPLAPNLRVGEIADGFLFHDPGSV